MDNGHPAGRSERPVQDPPADTSSLVKKQILREYFPEKSSSFIPIGYYSIKYCPGKALENRGREEKGIKFSKVDGKEKMCYTN